MDERDKCDVAQTEQVSEPQRRAWVTPSFAEMPLISAKVLGFGPTDGSE